MKKEIRKRTLSICRSCNYIFIDYRLTAFSLNNKLKNKSVKSSHIQGIYKGKVIPLQARCGPEGG